MNVADFMQWIATLRRHPLSALCGSICIVCGITCWYVYGNMKWLELEHKQVLQDSDLDLASMISGPSVRQERLAALAAATTSWLVAFTLIEGLVGLVLLRRALPAIDARAQATGSEPKILGASG